MKLKALVFTAMVASCQPIAVYPMTPIETYSFGNGLFKPSSVTLFQDGVCEHVVFDNQLAGGKYFEETTLGGHTVRLIMGNYTDPDIMFVIPAPGYYVDGVDQVAVDDGSIGTIIVCLEAMS